VLSDLQAYNYNDEEREEFVDSVHIYNKHLFDAVNETLEGMKA